MREGKRLHSSERKCLLVTPETLPDNLPAICGGLYSWVRENARNLWAGNYDGKRAR